jgi:hypothetical protein
MRAAAADGEALLESSILRALERSYLRRRKLVELKIRQVDGSSIDGFLKLGGGKNERHLVDFKATSTPQGGISELEVDGRKIAVAPPRALKRQQAATRPGSP